MKTVMNITFASRGLRTRLAGLRHAPAALGLAATLLLQACGGSGGGGGSPSVSDGLDRAQVCSANNPFRADAEAPITVGSLADEKAWVRAYVDSAYLWYDEVPSVSATLHADESSTLAFQRSIFGYFDALTAIPKDRFSFAYPTRLWKELIGSGAQASHGIAWVDTSDGTRDLRVAYVEDGSPAASAGVQRGDVLVSVDGILVSDSRTDAQDFIDTAISGFDPDPLAFVFARGGTTRPAVTLTAETVVNDPVPEASVLSVGAQKVAYLRFNDHNAPSESKLIAAFQGFQQTGVDDLVLDLRYNGGGYQFIASQLAYMIAGPDRTNTRVFERERYNAKRVQDNNGPAVPFYNVSCELDTLGDCTTENFLPYLSLGRVYVLTSENTCSASEALINGLRGIGVTVQLVGDTTCGKPYGFTAEDNCGISYFPIEFQGVNDAGFGDYANGFPATCSVTDDLDHELGDPAEAQLAAALELRATGLCPTAARLQTRALGEASARPVRRLQANPVRQNMFVRR